MCHLRLENRQLVPATNTHTHNTKAWHTCATYRFLHIFCKQNSQGMLTGLGITQGHLYSSEWLTYQQNCIVSGVKCSFSRLQFRDQKATEPTKSVISPTGNRTPVSRVTGGDTYHYTIEDNCYEASHQRSNPCPCKRMIIA